MSYIHIENAGKTFVENGQEFRALTSASLDHLAVVRVRF